MSHWNYRIVRIVERGTDVYSIKEVFYADDGEPEAYGDADALATGEDEEDPVESIQQQLEWMLEGARKPVLRYPEDFKKSKESL